MPRIDKVFLINGQNELLEWDLATEKQKQESKGVYVKYYQKKLNTNLGGGWDLEALKKMLAVETPEERKKRLSDEK